MQVARTAVGADADRVDAVRSAQDGESEGGVEADGRGGGRHEWYPGRSGGWRTGAGARRLPSGGVRVCMTGMEVS
ncbi:hypothetical protein GCM10010440_10970 [Kitasatospora cinereorecta]